MHLYAVANNGEKCYCNDRVITATIKCGKWVTHSYYRNQEERSKTELMGNSTVHTYFHSTIVIKTAYDTPLTSLADKFSPQKIEKAAGGAAILNWLPINKEELVGNVEVMGIMRENAHIIFTFKGNKKPSLAENFVVLADFKKVKVSWHL